MDSPVLLYPSFQDELESLRSLSRLRLHFLLSFWVSYSISQVYQFWLITTRRHYCAHGSCSYLLDWGMHSYPWRSSSGLCPSQTYGTSQYCGLYVRSHASCIECSALHPCIASWECARWKRSSFSWRCLLPSHFHDFNCIPCRLGRPFWCALVLHTASIHSGALSLWHRPIICLI